MKSIEQLLVLSKNPHYKMGEDEIRRLNDFLEEKSEKSSEPLPKQSSPKSSKKTPVTVRNIVTKADTGLPESVS